MSRRVHFETEVLYGTLFQPLCENNAGRDAIADAAAPVEMSDLEEEVTCRKCLRAMGYDAAPIEQLTECVGDPLHRRVA